MPPVFSAVTSRRWAAALLVACLAISARAQDCSSLTLATQEEVDAYACGTSVYDLKITGSVVDLRPLSPLTMVGNLNVVGTTQLTSLVGLENVRQINGPGGLTILDNAALESLDGLEGAEGISALRVWNNAALTSLAALGGARVSTYVGISENDALESLDGLGSVTSLGTRNSGVYVSGNDVLRDLSGLANLAVGGEQLRITDNDALVSIGLSSLQTVTSQVVIEDNDSLPSLQGLDALTSVNYVTIDGNDALVSFAGFGPARVDGTFRITDNGALTDLRGLDGLETVAYDVTIQGNGGMTSLNGLGVTSVGGHLAVSENPALVECSCGLSGVLYDGTTAGVGSGVTIADNAAGGVCTSLDVVLANPCGGTAGEEAPTAGLAVGVAPNPVAGLGRVTYALPHPGPARVTVFDALGRCVDILADGPHTAGAYEATWATGGLPPGLYLVRLDAEADRVVVPAVVAR